MAISKVSSRADWDFSYIDDTFDFDIPHLQSLYVRKTLIKTQKIFDYENLPETMPADDIELMLQTRGSIAVTNFNLSSLYAFTGGLGGEPSPYYRPTLYVVANPALKYSESLKIDEDCVVIRNDPLYMGLLPVIKHASYLLAQCDISFKFACINIRVPAIVKAKDDNTYRSAIEFFEQVSEGKEIGVVMDDDLADGIGVYDYSNSDISITHLIELKQYILSTFYQDLGIQLQFNMKREAINEAEAALSESVLYPTIDDMLLERQKGFDKVNKMYGTNIKVKLSSVWEQLRRTKEQSINLTESEIAVNKAEADTAESAEEIMNSEQSK